ncbi:MAG TPA: 30S ribosomal protein S12 methylthiotransferase RimO [Bacillota bacterium]
MKAGWISLGCPKNLADTEYIMGLLSDQYPLTTDPREAEILIINTCSFIQPATQESLDTIMEFAQYKRGQCKLLVVVGCLAQRYGVKVQRLIPEVDLWVGTGEYSRLPSLIAEALEKKTKGVYTAQPGWVGMNPEQRVLSTNGYTAYLKIAEGCNNHCLFCIIPHLRGKYRSRDFFQLITETKKLVAGGVKEVVLVAQDTTAYGQDLDGRTFCQLLSALDEIEGEFWLRILYTYPSRLDDELLTLMRDSKHICNYLDIPLQHVAPAVLRAMGRKVGPESYLELIERVRKFIPDISIRSTFLLGYPGETEADFQQVLAFLDQARLDWVGAFPYYRETGTAAAKLKPQVHPSTRRRRAREVLKVQQRISAAKNRALIGKRLKVLVEKKSRREQNVWIGRSYREAPEIDGFVEIEAPPDRLLQVGEFVEGTVTGGEAYEVRIRLDT